MIRWRIPHLRSSLLVAILLAACGSPTEPRTTPLQEGAWGGSDIALTVANSSAKFFSSSCYVGLMPRPIIDESGRFTVSGTLERQVGPPASSSAPEVTFTGQATANRVSFVGRYASGQTVGPFIAFFNVAAPRFSPCPP